MDDTNQTPEEMTQDERDALELKMLRDRAKSMNIPISNNMKLENIRKRIDDHLNGKSNDAGEEDDEDGEETPAAAKKTRQQVIQEIRENLRREELALVRCQIYNLNPEKNDLRGEIITVANKYLGTVRKMVPFGEATDGGYHIPRCIYNDLKSRKFQQKSQKKGQKGTEMQTRMVPEYNIVVMEPLSPAEMQDLAVRQAAAQRVSAE